MSNSLYPSPLKILQTLLEAGHDVCYLDTDPERLKQATLLGAHLVLDASKVNGKGIRHYEIVMAVHTPEWHGIHIKDYREIGMAHLETVDYGTPYPQFTNTNSTK